MGADKHTNMQRRIDKFNAARKAARRMQHVRTGQAWRAWRGRVAAAQAKRVLQYRAVVSWRKQAAKKALTVWVAYVAWRRDKKQIMQRCAAPQQMYQPELPSCMPAHRALLLQGITMHIAPPYAPLPSESACHKYCTSINH